ncbi:MAG: hypothetical protein ABSG67_03730 [Thermoguttaceae bacterium]
MAGLFRVLTAVVFTAHMMLGCCLHHAHASDGKDCPCSSPGTPAHDGQCPDSQGNGADHSQHGSPDCQGVKCSFVPPRSEACNSFGQLFQMFAAPLFQELPSLAGIADEQHCFAAGRLLTPIRLHPANQVLLI